jgi:glycosyltransferase involved in cell wall biosynthesis
MKVSIITVAQNAAATIGDTLDCVAAQTYPEIEHLVIDGASTDDTAAVIAAKSTPKTRFYSEPNTGLYDAMNKGLARATGDLIGFLNADDLFCRTDAVALLAAAIGDGDAVSGGVAIVCADDIDCLVRAYPSRPFGRWMLRFGHMPPHPGFYATRAAFDRVGAFDPAIRIGADFEWMVRFIAVHRLRYTPIPETLVTLCEGGLSNSGFASRKAINTDAVASLRRHDIMSSLPVVWSKYALKALQLVTPAHQWPTPAALRWPVDARLKDRTDGHPARR